MAAGADAPAIPGPVPVPVPVRRVMEEDEAWRLPCGGASRCGYVA